MLVGNPTSHLLPRVQSDMLLFPATFYKCVGSSFPQCSRKKKSMSLRELSNPSEYHIYTVSLKVDCSYPKNIITPSHLPLFFYYLCSLLFILFFFFFYPNSMSHPRKLNHEKESSHDWKGKSTVVKRVTYQEPNSGNFWGFQPSGKPLMVDCPHPLDFLFLFFLCSWIGLNIPILVMQGAHTCPLFFLFNLN